MSAAVKFAHELVPGDVYEPLVVTVTVEMNQQALFAQEQFAGAYLDPGTDRPALVCPALLLQLAANTKSPSFRLAPGTGSILAEAQTVFLGPAYVGRRLRVSWRVDAEYERRGRRYYVMEATIDDDEDGRLIIRRSLHLTFTRQQ